MHSSHHCFVVSIANRKVIRVLGKLEILELDENFGGHYMMAQNEIDLDRIVLTVVEAAGDAVDEQALIGRVPWDSP
jgi:small subunit ribosomal protein S19e